MDSSIIRKLSTLIKRYEKLENLLSNPKIISNQKQIYLLSKEYKKLSPIALLFHRWTKINKEIIHTKKLLKDKDIHICNMAQEELKKFHSDKLILEEKITTLLLLPKDQNDNRNCFIELRAATGGKEAAIFTGELFRMYVRYSEMRKWKIKIINFSHGEHGGYKEITAKISHHDGGTYGQLKFESGGHRVQRVPNTESQGRIHTSTCTVAVIPEIPSAELPTLNFNELKIDTFRSSGAGGQHVNTTDSAIRITHIPTGLTVACQDERSQHKNKAKALAVLGSRLYNIEIQRRQKETSHTRRNLLGTGERSDRIRTYNFPQGRITDHRVNLTIYKLNDILDGNLDILIQKIVQKNNLGISDTF